MPTVAEQHRACAVDQQGTQIGITAFADPQQLDPTPGSGLTRYQAEIGGELARRAELSGISDAGDDRTGDEGADSGYRCNASTLSLGAVANSSIRRSSSAIRAVAVRKPRAARSVHCATASAPLRRLPSKDRALEQGAPTQRYHHPELVQQTADLVGLQGADLHPLWRSRCNDNTACCCSLFTATKRISGRCAASQIACASAASVLLVFTNGRTNCAAMSFISCPNASQQSTPVVR